MQNQIAARDLNVFGSVLLELVLPIDFAAKPADVELLGFSTSKIGRIGRVRLN